jgi:hypothetical protein
MYQGWRHDEDGVVHVTREDGTEVVPTLAGKWADSYDLVDDRWRSVATPVAVRWGIPVEWLLAMAWRESGGNPLATSQDGGVGLMQITSSALKAGHTAEELLDGRVSLEVAARFIAALVKRPDVGRDFPRVSAAYNAGSVRPSDANDWGMTCTGSHIESEVCALNRGILRRLSTEAHERGEVMALVYQTSTSMLDEVWLEDRRRDG